MATVTDSDILNDCIYRTLENGNADAAGVCVFGMFTVSQIINAMNQRQWKFLKDTGCVATGPVVIPSSAGQQTYTFPNDYIDTLRLSYKVNRGQSYSLQRIDSWEIDAGAPEWDYSSGTPMGWNSSTLPTRTVDIAPIPQNSGQLGLLYVAVSATLTGLGVPLVIPETFSWAITWGVISDMLSSDGESLDIQRAQYAENRYEQGVELCKLLIQGVGN